MRAGKKTRCEIAAEVKANKFRDGAKILTILIDNLNWDDLDDEESDRMMSMISSMQVY